MKISNKFTTSSMTSFAPIEKWSYEETKELDDLVVVEHDLTAVLMSEDQEEIERIYFTCSSDQLIELLVGHLVTESYIRKLEELTSIELDETGKFAYIKGSFSKQELENKLKEKKLPRVSFSYENITKQGRETLSCSELFEKTGALHTASIWNEAQSFVAYSDLGRHNAIDKVIGKAVLEGIDLENCVLYTSGRMPYDMVKKVIAAGIPIMASRSAPTRESIALAMKHELTLLGFVRGKTINRYN